MRLEDLLYTYWWVGAIFVALIGLIALIILTCCAWIALQIGIDMWQQRARRKRQEIANG